MPAGSGALRRPSTSPRGSRPNGPRSRSSGEQLDEALVLRFDGPASATARMSSSCIATAAARWSMRCSGGACRHSTDFAPPRRGVHPSRLREWAHRPDRGRRARGLARGRDREHSGAQRCGWPKGAEAADRRVAGPHRRSCPPTAELAIDYVGGGCRTGRSDDRDEAPGAWPASWRVAGEAPGGASQGGVSGRRRGTTECRKVKPYQCNSWVTSESSSAPIAGTTRDVIEVPLALSGRPFLFVDTAGLRSSTDAIESIGIGLAQREVEGAESCLWLGEPEPRRRTHPRRILVHPKADLDRARPGGDSRFRR